MNKRRKTIALCLALGLLLLLAACGLEDPALVGTWESDFDITEILSDYWQEQNIRLNTEAKLYVQLRLILNEDGSCTMDYDSVDTRKLTDAYFLAVQEDLTEQVYAREEASGSSREETDATLAGMGTSVAALCETLLQEPRTMVEEFLNSAEIIENGVYRTQEGKLYLEQTKAELRDTPDHLDYSLENGILTIKFGDQTLLFGKN